MASAGVLPPSMFLDPVFWLAGAGVVLGLVLFFRGFPILERKRLIQSIPRSTVRGAALGLVEISGKAVGPYSIVAPLSEMDCYFYLVAIEGVPHSDPSTREETLCVPFFLDDGTGRILIDPRGSDSALRLTFSGEFTGSVPSYVRHFLDRHGVPPGAPVRLVEYSVRDGDHLFVLGTLEENVEPDSAAGSGKQEQSGFPAYLSRDAADLQHEMAFPELGTLKRDVTRPTDVATQFDLRPPVVLRKGRPGDLFILSSASQRDLVAGLAVSSAWRIWGGAAMALAALWLMLNRLGL